MAKGRKPKPTHLRVISGNAGKRPLNVDEPKPKRLLPKPPDWVKGRAKEMWGKLSSLLDQYGVITEMDSTALELFTQVYQEWRTAIAVVDEKGTTYETTTASGDKMYRARPEVAIASDAWRRLMAMMAEFGMTPSSRSRLQGGKACDDDPLESLLNGPRASR